MNSVARACPEGVNFPSIPILASGVMPFPPHQGHALLAFFFCLPNASSTSTLLWYFLQVIFLDPEAKRDIPLLRTPMQFYFKNKIKISHLIFKISPGARYYYYLFFFSTVEYTGTRLKSLLKSPELLRHGSGMILRSSGLQIPSHFHQVMLLSPLFSFIPTKLPLVQAWLTHILYRKKISNLGRAVSLACLILHVPYFSRDSYSTSLLDQ